MSLRCGLSGRRFTCGGCGRRRPSCPGGGGIRSRPWRRRRFWRRYRMLPDVVRQLRDRLIALHVSDHPGGNEKHMLPGEGALDWAALMEALREIDYQGPLDYECRWNDIPDLAERIRVLEENFAWLSGL